MIKQQSGFTFFEMILVICVIAILSIILLRNMTEIQARTERVVVEQTVNTLQNAAMIEVAEHIIAGTKEKLPAYQYANPMNLIIKPPKSYLGERDQVDLSTAEAGTWVFNRSDRVLYYFIRFDEYIYSDLQDPSRLKFRLKLVYTDKNQNFQFDPKTDDVEGLELKSLGDYYWVGE